MPLIQQAQLQTKTDLEALTSVTEWFQWFQYPPLTEKLWLEGQIALLEGFTNAVNHAHRHLSPEMPIELDAQLFTERLQIRIWDYGEFYDFTTTLKQLQQLTADPAFNPQEREAHWGSILLLKLIHEHGWVIAYHRQQDNRNCFFIEKVFE